jgi:hypothetical protein
MYASIALVGCLTALVPAVFAVPTGPGGSGDRGLSIRQVSIGPEVSLFNLPQKITPPSGNLAAVFWGQGITC